MGTEIIGSEIKYRAHIFNVAQMEVRLPDGRLRKYDLIEHNPAVMIIPVTNDGQILFVRQFRMGAKKELLELPAGVLNPDEDPLAGAVRECREETGFDSKDIRRIGGFFMTPGYCDEYIHVFLARDLVDNPLPQDADEFLNTISLPIAEAYALAENGTYEDVKTIAALMMAQKEIRK